MGEAKAGFLTQGKTENRIARIGIGQKEVTMVYDASFGMKYQDKICL